MANGPDNTMQDLLRMQSMLPTAQKQTAVFGILADVQFNSTSLAAAAPKIGDGKLLKTKQRGGGLFDKILNDMGFNKEAFASLQQAPVQQINSVAEITGSGLPGVSSFVDIVGSPRGGFSEIG